jgi:hypothetical protein
VLATFLVLSIGVYAMFKKLKVLFWHSFFMNYLEGLIVRLDNIVWRNRWNKHRKDK